MLSWATLIFKRICNNPLPSFLLQLPGALAAFMAGAYFTSISARQCKAYISAIYTIEWQFF